VSTSKRDDFITRGPCPTGKCEHRAFVHVEGQCVICKDKKALREIGEWGCA
jgi:hypothetical protein